MTGPTLDDYEPHDGWNGEGGWEKCPHCDQSLWPEKYSGKVYDQDGTEYEHFTHTEPGTGPFFCPECFNELENNRRAQENSSLEAWSE